MPISKIIRTDRFKKEYKKLSEENKKAFKRQLEKFLNNPKPPFHRSLRIKKVQGTKDIFEFTVTMEIRMTFQFGNNSIILRNIGEHDITLKNK